MSLTDQQIAAIRELREAWPESSLVIIGATALGFYYEMDWRKTADVDLVLAIELEEFPHAILEQPGWTQHPQKGHELTSPGGAKVDLLPAGPKLLRCGEIRWKGGQVMSLVGLDLAFEHARLHEVQAGFFVHVAPPAVIAVLKMISYCDRPRERERDLDDLCRLLELYVAEESPRRWDEANECGEAPVAALETKASRSRSRVSFGPVSATSMPIPSAASMARSRA